VNKAIVVGHLGRDPERKSFADGGSIVTFSLATGERWTDKRTGERREKTEWHNVVVQNEHAQKAAMDYLRKGSQVYVEGMLRTRKWAGSDGVERYATEIVVTPFRGEIALLDRAGERGGPAAEAPPAAAAPPSAAPEMRDALDDEIPF
jgi:single-strand DNA-binding protein